MNASSDATATRPGRGRRAGRSSGDERERDILNTLEQLLEKQNFHEISIDDLARGAGISRPTFYFYFPSKVAVLLTLLDAIVVEANAGRDQAQVGLENNPAEHVRQGIEAYLQTFGRHRAVAFAAAEAQSSSPEVRELWNGVREGWVQDAATNIDIERKRVGAKTEVSSRDLAIALIQMNENVLRTSFAGEQPAIDEAVVLDVLQAIWINAIYGDKSP
jgi:AcrR family transcriptional regulator